MLLGAHCSIAGGLRTAVEEAKYIRCESVQIFSRSPRKLRDTKPLDPMEVAAFKAGLRDVGVRAIMIHANYLINLGSPRKRLLRVARDGFREELDRAQVLGVPLVVIHPGAGLGRRGVARTIRTIAESLDACIEAANAPDVSPCLENTAGQGSNVASTFEQIRDILDASKHADRLTVCFDTCHAFAAGYDLRTRSGYEDVFGRFGDVVGLDRLRAFHLNDSRGELGSRVDRHEHIGRGEIGRDAFRFLVNDSRFEDVPGCLETPGENKDFRRNLKLLKSMRGEKPSSPRHLGPSPGTRRRRGRAA